MCMVAAEGVESRDVVQVVRLTDAYHATLTEERLPIRKELVSVLGGY